MQSWCHAQVSEDVCPTSCQDAVPAGAKARCLTGCSALVAPDAQKAGGEPCDLAMTGAEETCSQDMQVDEAGGFVMGYNHVSTLAMW